VIRADGRGLTRPLYRRRRREDPHALGEMQTLHISKVKDGPDDKATDIWFATERDSFRCACCGRQGRRARRPDRHPHRQLMRFSRPLLDACTAAFAAVLPLQEPADAALSAFSAAIRRSASATVRPSPIGVRGPASQAPARPDRRQGQPEATGDRDLGPAAGASLRDLEPCCAARRRNGSPRRSGKLRGAALRRPVRAPGLGAREVEAALSTSRLARAGGSLLQTAPLDLRVNPIKMSREAVAQRLAEDGMRAVPTPYSPTACASRVAPRSTATRVSRGRRRSPGRGQPAACAIWSRPSAAKWWSTFARVPGARRRPRGLMRSTGRLYAFDISPKRLAPALWSTYIAMLVIRLPKSIEHDWKSSPTVPAVPSLLMFAKRSCSILKTSRTCILRSVLGPHPQPRRGHYSAGSRDEASSLNHPFLIVLRNARRAPR